MQRRRRAPLRRDGNGDVLEKGENRLPGEPTRIERQKAMSLEEMAAASRQVCERGAKTKGKGYRESWNGYELHIDAADGQIPISCFWTSPS
ncbi:MAG: hypothetical protein V1800_04525 [Candidatus Latescibacterota bacterium]